MRKLLLGVVAVLVLGLGAMAAEPIVVGCKNFTEQYVIGEMIAQLLEYHGFEVERAFDLSSMAVRSGLEAGDIDIYAEYTGTAWMAHFGFPHYPALGHNALYWATKAVDETHGIVWLNPIWNHNTYALASWSEYAEEHGLVTMSDLAAWYNENDGKISTYIDFEFSVRPDGLPFLEEFYGFHVNPDYLSTGSPGVSLMALEQRVCDVTMVFGTDAPIAKYGWHVYVDDKGFFPPYDLTPNVRREVLEAHPEIADILNELVATFPGPTPDVTVAPEEVAECMAVWQELNAKVDIDKLEPDEAAHEYLVEQGLIEE